MKSQLFFLPFSGASVKYYKSWEKHFDSNIKIDLVELPGRGLRINEPFCSSIDEAIHDLSNNILNRIESDNFFLFGHSMGALLVYHISLEFQDKKLSVPSQIFLSGRTSPKYRFHPNIEQMSDADLIQELKSLGLNSIEIYKHPRAGKYYLSILRNDYKLIDTYKKVDKKLTSKGTVLYGLEDPLCIDINSWNAYFEGEVNYHEFSDSHFYLNNCMRVVQLIKEYIN